MAGQIENGFRFARGGQDIAKLQNASVFFKGEANLLQAERGPKISYRGDSNEKADNFSSVFLFSTLRACADDGIWREIRSKFQLSSSSSSFILFRLFLHAPHAAAAALAVASAASAAVRPARTPRADQSPCANFCVAAPAFRTKEAPYDHPSRSRESDGATLAFRRWRNLPQKVFLSSY